MTNRLASLRDVTIDQAALKDVPARVAVHYGLIPIDRGNGVMRVALDRVPAPELMDELRLILRSEVDVLVAPMEEIQKAIKTYYGVGAETLEHIQGVSHVEEPVAGAPEELDGVQDASVTKLVNQIFLEAWRARATDVHLEPYADEMRVRYRIDGVLYETKMSDALKRFQAAVISRVKIMAQLSIAEKRMPQDGRIKVRVEGKDLDMRVSTLPTPFGEGIVIRLLTSRQLLDLAHLGFEPKDMERLGSYLGKPHGILFLTGPTGSGKTTTLYGFLNQINRSERKIITLEDPIEYQMKGVTQVQVNPKVGLTFAAGLRSMLRHDPDVMMVGEVRDLETAEIAVRVALTGHMVFSTLHTNDAAGAVTRLLDIGVEPFLVSSSVLGLIAQRLVRLICPACKREKSMSSSVAMEFGLSPAESAVSVWEGAGCETCRGTGYHGRTVIYEILPVTPAIRELIMARAPANLLREKALAEGMTPIRRCGWEKVRAGLTTAEEVLRVTMRDE